jgi:hypothetical protein
MRDRISHRCVAEAAANQTPILDRADVHRLREEAKRVFERCLRRVPPDETSRKLVKQGLVLRAARGHQLACRVWFEHASILRGTLIAARSRCDSREGEDVRVVRETRVRRLRFANPVAAACSRAFAGAA